MKMVMMLNKSWSLFAMRYSSVAYVHAPLYCGSHAKYSMAIQCSLSSLKQCFLHRSTIWKPCAWTTTITRTVTFGNVNDTFHGWSACQCIVARCVPQHTSFPQPSEHYVLSLSHLEAAGYLKLTLFLIFFYPRTIFSAAYYSVVSGAQSCCGLHATRLNFQDHTSKWCIYWI